MKKTALYTVVYTKVYALQYIELYGITLYCALYKPAELGVDVLERGCQDASDVGHVEVHQGDPDQGVQHRRDLPQRGFCRQVSITFQGKWTSVK